MSTTDGYRRSRLVIGAGGSLWLMADDVVLPATGEQVATDKIGDNHYQLVKLVTGEENADQPIYGLGDTHALKVGEETRPSGFGHRSDLETAVGLPDLDDFPEARLAIVTVEGGDVRWRPDGATTAPTATVGMLVLDGGTVPMFFSPEGLAPVRFIAATGDPSISVVYA